MSNRSFKNVLKQFEDKEIQFAYIDLFCGAGGTSTGVNKSKFGKVIYCINHDIKAIESHAANHPNALHAVEDIRVAGLSTLIKLVNELRRLYPHVKVILWGSLECTNFSDAKGGVPRDPDSRTLAVHLFRYIDLIKPDYVEIENVREFMAWGPMFSITNKTDEGYLTCPVEFKEMEVIVYYDQEGNEIKVTEENLFDVEDLVIKKELRLVAYWKGKPESRDNGKYWVRWCQKICGKGFRQDWRMLTAADFGGRTIRNRLFGMFASGELPIVWPLPTHSKTPSKNAMFGDLKPWKPVRDCLDLENEGESIFSRKEQLVDNSLDRLKEGLIKFVGQNDKTFMTYYHDDNPYAQLMELGASKIQKKSNGNFPLIFQDMVSYQNPKTGKTTKGLGIIFPEAAERYRPKFNENSNLSYRKEIELMLMKYHGKGNNLLDPNFPASTLTTRDRIAVAFIYRDFSRSGFLNDINLPIGTLPTVPKANLITCNPFLMCTQFNNIGTDLMRPAPVITANKKYHYIVNPQYYSKGASIDDPSQTLIARMDKAPLYLSTVEGGEVFVIIYEDDTPGMIRLKLAMASYAIGDIKYRMLTIPEMLHIQGFPKGYKMVGTLTDQKRFIGNSVHTDVVEAMVNAKGEYFLSNPKYGLN